MLPEGHRKRLWGGRRKDGVCGACDPREAEEVPLRAVDGWFESFNLAVAILLTVEYEDCGSHPHLFDKEGFCWGCGVLDAETVYQEARGTIKKFGLEKNLYG
jgi:hypothetical protein